METFITDVITAVVLLLAVLLMYLHLLKLIFGVKQELTHQSQIIQTAADNLQKSLLQLAEKTADSTPDSTPDWQREDATTEALTPRSIYPESCHSDGSMNTVIHVIHASDLEPISPRSDVSLEDFWRTSESNESARCDATLCDAC